NGVLTLDYTLSDDGKVNMVTVDMGQPVLDLPGIGVIESQLSELVEDTEDSMIFVGMGNPHAVDMIDEDDIDPTIYPHSDSAWAALGEAIEHHPAFPSRINYHHVVIHSPTRVTVRHWERGSGATLACGTGACAVCVAGVLTGRTDRQITAHLPGGDLQLEWREADAAEGGNHVFMTGPATTVFEGEWLL
ncbi:MAG: diaminopimelate epimerase, partial [Rhodospirillales bacterium]|nr:diaminopimelate epimerase [Rhodospirillales bacterium]